MGLAGAVLLIVVAGLLATGWPQRKLVQVAARKILGVEVEVADLTSLGALRIGELSVFSSAAAQAERKPTFAAEGIVVDYSLFPGEASYISSVSIDKLTLYLDASNPGETNFDFLLQPSGRDPEPYIPRRIRVEEVSCDLALPAAHITVEGVRISGTAKAGEYTLEVASNALNASWWVHSPENVTVIAEGFVQIQAAGGSQGLRLSTLIGIPGLIEIDGSLTTPDLENLDPVEVEFKRLRIFGNDLPAITKELLPLPLQFDVLDCSGSSFRMSFEEGEFSLSKGQIRAVCQNLLIGDPAHSLFDGDLAVEADLEGDDVLGGTLDLTFNRDQQIHILLSGASSAGHLEASLENWPRGAVTDLAPADFRAYLEALDYDLLGGHVELDWSETGYDIQGEVQSRSAAPKSGDAIHLAFKAHGTAEGEPLLDGDLDLRIGEGVLNGLARFETRDHYAAVFTLDNIDPKPWAQFLGQASLPESFRAVLNGTIALETGAETDTLSISPSLTLAPFVFEPFAFDRIDISGDLQIPGTFDRLHSEGILVKADDTTYISLTGLSAAADPPGLQGEIDGNLDLALLGEAFGFGDLWGEVAFKGPLHLDGDRIEVTLSAWTDLVGYGDFSTPYGTPLTLEVGLSLDIADTRGSLTRFESHLGEGTRLALEQVEFGLSPLEAKGQIDFRSDLVPIVDMALLGAAQGTATAAVQFTYSEEGGLDAQWQTGLEAAKLSLPDDAATLNGVSFNGKGTHDGTLDGQGTLSVEVLSVAGAQIRSLSGKVLIQDAVLLVSDATAILFNGNLTASIRAGILEEGLPIALTAQARRIDLAVLTEEVQPPSVKLTGIADASATLVYALDGLRDFTLDADSHEEFSLNRDAVEQVLQSEQFRNLFGAKKMEKAMGKFLGSKPQRPFDTAELHLGLEEERLRGEVLLKSVKTSDYHGLSLAIDIAMDASALAQTLALLEESEMGNVEF